MALAILIVWSVCFVCMFYSIIESAVNKKPISIWMALFFVFTGIFYGIYIWRDYLAKY